MGDTGIVIISLVGDDDDQQAWMRALRDKPGATILEVHLLDETPSEHVRSITAFAEEHGMSLRLYRMPGQGSAAEAVDETP